MAFQKVKELDYQASYWVAHLLGYDSIVRKFFQIITITGTAILWWVVLPIAFFAFEDLRQELYTMFVVTTAMTFLVYALKLTIRRKRPDFKDDRYATVSFDIFSFPSGHAARSTYVSVLMPIYTPQLAIVWYLWAIIMIFSRLVIGVHYISDIIGGIVMALIALIVMYAIGWLPLLPLPGFL